MYTFDTDEESAMETYYKVCDAYCKVFDRIGVQYEKGTETFFMQSAEIRWMVHFQSWLYWNKREIR